MPAADLDLLQRAVARAAEISLGFVGPEARRWDKSDGAGPVTEADLAVNASLEADLRAARPDYGWLSEESPEAHGDLGARRIFVVDPIDGTRSFIEGSGTWAISVAVVEDGQPTAAIVSLPARDLIFDAARGQGARLNGTPIAPSFRSELRGAQMLAPRPAMEPRFWPGGIPEITRHHRPSLAYRLCLAASGRFDAMITLRDAWEWDIAAGALIASEAGCRVSDRDGAPLRFNSPDLKTRGVLVAHPDLHRQLITRLIPSS